MYTETFQTYVYTVYGLVDNATGLSAVPVPSLLQM